MVQLNISHFIQGLCEGDAVAQKRIFEHYYPYAMSIALRYTKDTQQAEEVVNDSFMKAFDKIGSYLQSAPFKSWLSKIVVNTSIDKIRTEKRQPIFAELNDGDTIHMTNHFDPEDAFKRNIAEEKILKVIQSLPKQYKLVFNMYVFEGYKHREIADILGISQSTSKTNYLRAKGQVMKKIKMMPEFSTQVTTSL